MITDPWKQAFELTKMPVGKSPQQLGQPQPPLELPFPAGARPIPMMKPDEWKIPSADLQRTIALRQTLRKYSDQSLSMDELSFLLWATQGVKMVDEQRRHTKRTVPSAGARHAFETYLLLNRVEGLEPGLYRYAAIDHAIYEMKAVADVGEKIKEGCLGQEQITGCAAAFFWVVVSERMFWRYQERGFRYVLLDAGHVCQNLYLAAEAIHCGVCAIAAFDDGLVNKALGLDGSALFTAYIASVGKRE
jgi:SagB-type dehydrogenase family enzyme